MIAVSKILNFTVSGGFQITVSGGGLAWPEQTRNRRVRARYLPHPYLLRREPCRESGES